MEYRKLGRTGLDVSAIGLGTEHIEQQGEVMDSILGTAVDAGISYVDLLHTRTDYWNEFGSVFRSYRDKFILAAHWGSGPHYSLDYCQQTFDNILSCIGNNYVEIAMLTMVDTERKWNEWVPTAVERLQWYQERGQVGYIGMSTHRVPMALKAIKSGIIDVLMYPINLTSHVIEADRTLCQVCSDDGVGFVAMKPYRGGTLFCVEGKPSGITPVQCLHYVLRLPVSTAVPGPKNARELRATLHCLEATEEEKDYQLAIADVHRHLAGTCTSCNHCLPCPQDIDIGEIMSLVEWASFGLADWSDEKPEILTAYAALPIKASECTECGICMERCPFDVDVVAKMQKAIELFETDPG